MKKVNFYLQLNTNENLFWIRKIQLRFFILMSLLVVSCLKAERQNMDVLLPESESPPQTKIMTKDIVLKIAANTLKISDETATLYEVLIVSQIENNQSVKDFFIPIQSKEKKMEFRVKGFDFIIIGSIENFTYQKGNEYFIEVTEIDKYVLRSKEKSTHYYSYKLKKIISQKNEK